MASDTKFFSFPDGNNGNNDLATLLALNGNNNGVFGNGGLGGGILGFFLGLLCSNGGFGNGLFGGGNNNTSDLLMQAITSQGEQSRTAINALSAALGQDFSLVNSSIQTISTAINQIGNQQGLNAMQVINAIQSGNATLANQLSNACCNMQNAMTQGFAGVQQSIAAKSAADELGKCQQTYTLVDTMNRNFLALDNKIDALESSRKDREITALTSEVATLKSQNFTTGVVQQAVAPVIGQINALAKEVDDIKCKLPATVNVEYPNLVAVNATPYVNGGFYGNSGYNYYGGNGFGGNIVF